MKLAFLVCFPILILLCGCGEEVNRPAFQTHQVSELSDQGVTFNAKLSIIGDLPVTNYGFVWASHSQPVITDSVHFFNASPVTGNFTVRITDDLVTDTEYYVRAFVHTSKELFYSNEVKFKSLGSATPKIADFNPKHGGSREKVIITGEHFSEDLKNVEVFVRKELLLLKQKKNLATGFSVLTYQVPKMRYMI